MSYITRQPLPPPSDASAAHGFHHGATASSSSFTYLSNRPAGTDAPAYPGYDQDSGAQVDLHAVGSASASPPLPAEGASVKRYHTVSHGGQGGVRSSEAMAGENSSAWGGRDGAPAQAGGPGGPPAEGRSRLQSDWRRRAPQDPGRASFSQAGPPTRQDGNDEEVIYAPAVEDEDEAADEVLVDGKANLFRQASLPTASGGLRLGSNSRFSTSSAMNNTSLPPKPSNLSHSHSLSHSVTTSSGLSRNPAITARSARGLSFSSSGSAGRMGAIGSGSGAAAGYGVGNASDVGEDDTIGREMAAVGRSSSLKAAVGKPDWRMTSESTSLAHQRSYSTSSGTFSDASASRQPGFASLGRSNSGRAAGFGPSSTSHAHTKSLFQRVPSPPQQPPLSSTAALPPSAWTSAIGSAVGDAYTSVIASGQSTAGLQGSNYGDEVDETGASVRRTHSLQHGYGASSKIQERLARSPALFPTYQRQGPPSALPRQPKKDQLRDGEIEPPTSPIRRSPWSATEVTPENDGWQDLRSGANQGPATREFLQRRAMEGIDGPQTSQAQQDQLRNAFEAIQLGNEILGGGSTAAPTRSPAVAAQHSLLYQMAMTDDVVDRGRPATSNNLSGYDPSVLQSAVNLTLSPIPGSRTQSQQPGGRIGLGQDLPGQFQPSRDDYVDLTDSWSAGPPQMTRQFSNPQQGASRDFEPRWGQPPANAYNTGYTPAMQSYAGPQDPGQVLYPQQHFAQMSVGLQPYMQQMPAHQQRGPPPPEPVKIPDAVAEKAAADVRQMVAAKGLNPVDFDLDPVNARFFVIKSFTEDDVHKSLKHDIWASTTFGNQRLDRAFQESQGRGPVYLFFSVNGSGHFCGVAQMTTAVDYNKTSTVWAQDKWKGIFGVKWIFVRDIPNAMLRHIRLLNTQEQKPITNSRDTQELLLEAGVAVLKIFAMYKEKTSLLEDFGYYEMQAAQKRAAQDAQGTMDGSGILKDTPQPQATEVRPPMHVDRLPPQGGMVKGFNPAGPPSLAPTRFAVVGGSMNGRGGYRGGR